MHYGTFGGLPTRILYVFVGVAPLVLFVTVFLCGGIAIEQNLLQDLLNGSF
ncbi:MAG: hypothetical protein V7L27_32615 [Nostoc sp.]|uniref:hypothetical protein n=1 Tax=Nostoc sp. TaxID=1180 RepID=UPI002FFB8D5A